MSMMVERDGVFQGRILEYGLREFESGAVAITIRAALDTIWDGEQWLDWKQYDMEAIGSLFIIKKDGTINTQAVESVIKAAGWDGSMNSVVHGTWQPTPCQFVIRGETYKNAMTYKIAFVNEFNSSPGGMTNIDADKAKQMEAKYGASLRAVAGNVKRNAMPAPAAKAMPAPAKAASGAWKPPSTPVADPAKTADEIPF